ncbi:hypothetical protein ACFLXT_05405, partial [Chloroflexota bacterium]
GRNAGYNLRGEEIENHIRTILDAIADAEMEEGERKVCMHKIIEMSRFLKILGPQVIQITLSCDSRPQPVSYVIKTTSSSVDYITVISGKQNNATIDINIDLDEAINSLNGCSSFNLVNCLPTLMKWVQSIKGALNVLKLCVALTTDWGCSYLKDKFTVIRNDRHAITG